MNGNGSKDAAHDRLRRRILIATLVTAAVVAAATGAVAVALATASGPEADAAPSASPGASVAPDPVPSPTGEPASAGAPVLPFGGDCAAAIADAEVDTLRAAGMGSAPHPWDLQQETVLGGLSCAWGSEDAYLATVLSLEAYPESAVPDEVESGVQQGCAPTEDGQRLACSESAVVGGVWIHAQVSGDAATLPQDGAQRMLAQAAARVSASPRPHAALRTDAWWTLPDCAGLSGALDPAALGVRAITPSPDAYVPPVDAFHVPQTAGATSACTLVLEGDGAGGGRTVVLTFVPGGADAVASARAAGATDTAVDGAADAVLASGRDRWEGSPGHLLVSDGTNVLSVVGGIDAGDPLEIALAAQVLAALAA